ncbi:ABC transporter substrate-binding protein [Microbacterium sp.]|uniref:ABC transporter substrate-binding protein n=1 Tax=Microbacterium sp. TaxID=51671 RepID=UPI0028122CE3|nr:ABC transporter substrate-binding protein [Microbacterium sp.]
MRSTSLTMPRPRRAGAFAGLALTAVALAACAPPGAAGGKPVEDAKPKVSLAPDETADGFDLEKLVAAAKKEGPITIYDQTGKVVQIAEAFTAKYGIEATGVKIETNVIEKVRTEGKSGNVIGDVLASAEVAGVYSLIEDGLLTNWVPGDMYDKLPEEARYPFLNLYETYVWTYNAAAFPDGCPVENVWELTEPDWKGRVALPDPEKFATYPIGWNQSARDHDDEFADAYEAQFGEEIDTDEESAVHEWLKRFAQNSPIVGKDAEAPSDAVGGEGQPDPAIALIPGSKYRNNEDKGYAQAVCTDLEPYAGWTVPQSMAYASNTDSPNAAKLYIHFATSQEGMEFVMPDGKASFSPDVKPAEDRHGLLALADEGKLQPYSTEYLSDDFSSISEWLDFWRSSR